MLSDFILSAVDLHVLPTNVMAGLLLGSYCPGPCMFLRTKFKSLGLALVVRIELMLTVMALAVKAKENRHRARVLV